MLLNVLILLDNQLLYIFYFAMITNLLDENLLPETETITFNFRIYLFTLGLNFRHKSAYLLSSETKNMSVIVSFVHKIRIIFQNFYSSTNISLRFFLSFIKPTITTVTRMSEVSFHCFHRHIDRKNDLKELYIFNIKY